MAAIYAVRELALLISLVDLEIVRADRSPERVRGNPSSGIRCRWRHR